MNISLEMLFFIPCMIWAFSGMKLMMISGGALSDMYNERRLSQVAFLVSSLIIAAVAFS